MEEKKVDAIVDDVSKMSKTELKKLRNTAKVYDKKSRMYFEKYKNELQPMFEEAEAAYEKNKPSDKPAEIDSTKIIEIIKSGDKIREANLFMKLQSSKNTLKSQRVMINEKVNFIFAGTPEQMDIIETRVAEVTEEAIEKATLEELTQFLTFDGEVVPLNFMDLMSEKDKMDGIKEFLLYLKSVNDTTQEIDNQIKEIDSICENFSDVVKEKSKDIYEWDKWIYDLFREKANDPNLSEDEKVRINRIIEVKNDALSLEPIIEYIKDEIALNRKASLINAYNTRFDDTLTKAEKYAEKNGFHIYFPLYDGIDECIGRKEKNFFPYIFARFIKFGCDKFGKVDNAFIAQISQNLIMFKNNKMKEPNKSTFANALTTIYKMILD